MGKIKTWFDALPNTRKIEIYQATRLTYESCAIEGNTLSENEVFNLVVNDLFVKETKKSNLEE